MNHKTYLLVFLVYLCHKTDGWDTTSIQISGGETPSLSYVNSLGFVTAFTVGGKLNVFHGTNSLSQWERYSAFENITMSNATVLDYGNSSAMIVLRNNSGIYYGDYDGATTTQLTFLHNSQYWTASSDNNGTILVGYYYSFNTWRITKIRSDPNYHTDSYTTSNDLTIYNGDPNHWLLCFTESGSLMCRVANAMIEFQSVMISGFPQDYSVAFFSATYNTDQQYWDVITTDSTSTCYQVRIFPDLTKEIFGGRTMTLNGKMQINYIGNDLLLMTSTRGTSIETVQYIAFNNLDGTIVVNNDIEEGSLVKTVVGKHNGISFAVAIYQVLPDLQIKAAYLNLDTITTTTTTTISGSTSTPTSFIITSSGATSGTSGTTESPTTDTSSTGNSATTQSTSSGSGKVNTSDSSTSSTSTTGLTTGPTTGTTTGTTTETPNNVENGTESSNDMTVTIVGVVVGAFVFLIIVAMIMFLIYRLKNKSNNGSNGPHQSVSLSSLGQIIKDIEIMERLGGGQFGDVYRGIWQKSTVVALKKPKSLEGLEEVENESAVLRALSHVNVVQFFGIYVDNNGSKYMVTEYMSKGSLCQLIDEQRNNLTQFDLLCMARDTVVGMVYLSSKGIVHRDLALRNLLANPSNVTGIKYVVKVADFGMSKVITDNSYYKTDNKTIPAKWCSPEVIEFGKFSTQSDVFAFGVVLWEIFSFGKTPWSGLSNAEAIDLVLKGKRMEAPENCPNEISKLMFKCWQPRPEERPSFTEIHTVIDSFFHNFIRESQIAQTSHININITTENMYHNNNNNNNNNNNHNSSKDEKLYHNNNV